MSNICKITGKKTISGNTISHANNKNKRVFKVNLRNKRFFIENRWIKLKVSAFGIKKIKVIGIEKVIYKYTLYVC
jgi:large subunit ribosomal protein L28